MNQFLEFSRSRKFSDDIGRDTGDDLLVDTSGYIYYNQGSPIGHIEADGENYHVHVARDEITTAHLHEAEVFLWHNWVESQWVSDDE